MARDGLENRNLGQSRSHSDEVEYPEAGGSREGSLGECARSTLRPHCRSKEEWSSCSGSGGCQGSELRLVLCSIVMLLFRPYSYGHRASRICRLKFPLAPQCRWSFSPPHWAAGWWCEAREVESMLGNHGPRLASGEAPTATACLPNSITPIVDHSLNAFFYVAKGRDWSAPEAHVHHGSVFNTHGRCYASKGN